MNASKQLVNLAGTLVVVILLVAGVVLVALPFYSGSLAIDSEKRTVEQSNSTYEQQIARLSAAEEEIAAVDEDLATLRTEIASAPRLDEVHALIARSAERVDARVESIAAEPAESWVARDVIDEEGVAVAAEEEPADTAASPTPAATDGDGGDGESAPAAEPEAPATELTPQQQVLLTITLDMTLPFLGGGDEGTDVEDSTEVDEETLTSTAKRVSAFVDGLREGPRLVSIIDVNFADGKVVVSALAFFQTEDAS
ncbi:hypothetical protein LJR045_001110 [Microbacterium sp. LjRoot45]|uniref:hypothetical protein n=1 Tax=Microbacterium sp. LjRoot45 TaxID=3342329 RepID=UPI003ECCCCE0